MTRFHLEVVFIVLAFAGVFRVNAQTERCGQPSALTTPLRIKAEHEQYNVRLREMVGNVRVNSRKLFGPIAAIFNEGDMFTQKGLGEAMKRLSKVKGIYPLTADDLEVRLLDASKQIDILFCVRENPRH